MKLNLGSGDKYLDGYVNVDINPWIEKDMAADLAAQRFPFKDNSFTEVRAFDFLEHIPIERTIRLIEEIYRVLKPRGIFEHSTPSTDGRGAFMDLNHRSFWNINSWLYFCHDAWREIYNYRAVFKVIRLQDVITDNALRIIHTHGVFEALK